MAVAWLALVIATTGLGLHRAIGFPPQAVMEFLLLALPLAGLATNRRLRTALAAGGWTHMLAGSALVGGLFVGQFHGAVHDTFPFVPWTMYATTAPAEAVFHEYTALRRDGTRQALNPRALLGAFGASITNRLDELARAIREEARPDLRRTFIANYEALLRAMARAYNRSHPENPLRSILVSRNLVPRRGYCGPACVRSEPFWTIEGEG